MARASTRRLLQVLPSGVTTHFGASASTYTFTATTAGFKETFGASATSIVFSATTAGVRTAFGAAALPIVFSATTAGAVTAIAGDLTGDGTLTGELEFAPLELAADLTGDGTLTGNAVLASSQSLSATLTGDGTLTGALRSLGGPRFLPSAAGSPAAPMRTSATSAGASSRPTRSRLGPVSCLLWPETSLAPDTLLHPDGCIVATPTRGTPTPAGSP